jgi:hypothetical protein
MSFQLGRRQSKALFAFLQAHIGDSDGYGIWIIESGRAATALGHELNLIDVVG